MSDLVRHDQEGPLTIVHGDGVRVQDEEGRSYIEAVSGLWSISLGFGQKRLADAAYKQLLELPSYHLFRHISTPAQSNWQRGCSPLHLFRRARFSSPTRARRRTTQLSSSYGTATTRWVAPRRKRSSPEQGLITAPRNRGKSPGTQAIACWRMSAARLVTAGASSTPRRSPR